MRSVVGRVLGAHFYERPLFLVGAGRSGTIVLYKALGAHRRIFTMPSEDPLITSFASIVSLFETNPEKEYYRESVKLPKDHLYRQLRRLCFESAAGPHYGFKTLVKYVLRYGPTLAGKRFWCVKTFPVEEHCKGLLRLYPGARFVYVVRNGIDVVRSRTRFPAFREQKFSQHCEVWANAARKFGYLSTLERAVTVRHEELLTSPSQVFKRISDSLGLEYDPRPTQFAEQTLVHSLDDKSTHTGVDVRKKLENRSPAYEKWSPEERDTFMRICAEPMRQLGYEMPF